MTTRNERPQFHRVCRPQYPRLIVVAKAPILWALNRNWLKSLPFLNKFGPSGAASFFDRRENQLSFDRRENQPPRQYLHSKNRRNNNRLDRSIAWGKGPFSRRTPNFPSSISETGSQQTASSRGESANFRFLARCDCEAPALRRRPTPSHDLRPAPRRAFDSTNFRFLSRRRPLFDRMISLPSRGPWDEKALIGNPPLPSGQ